MNIDSNATTAILGSSEMSNNLSIQNRKSSQSSSSFQEQLKKSSNEEVCESETEKSENVEKAAENKSSEKADKKNVKDTSKEKTDKVEQKDQSTQSQSNQQNALNGQISVTGEQNADAYSMLSDQVKNYMLKNGGQFNLNNINLMTATTRAEISSVSPKVDYTSIQMSDSDALFFANLVKNTDMSMQSVSSEFQKMLSGGQVQQAQSTAKASAALIAALQESSKTNQPFRIDFDKDVSVILKVDKDGNINANFIPGDKAVEAYLRNNIEFLRQRFNEENIAYGDLNYSKSRQEKDEKEQRNKKEHRDE